MAKMTKDELVNAIAELTVLELSELVKAIEEKFGVKAAAPAVAVAAAPAAAGAAAAEEKDEFNVVLTAVDAAKKIAVIKVVREITPVSVCCARAALKVIKNEPERVKRLHDISAYMRKCLKDRGVKIIESETPIIPIYVYEDEKAFIACKLLLDRGVYVNPVISPATPVGQALLRTSYTADHTKEHCQEAADKIKEVLDILQTM